MMGTAGEKARYDAYLDAMIARFLSWKLPKDFYPDAGVSFDRRNDYESPHWPIGTNLLSAEQAREMFKQCVPPSCFDIAME